MDGWMLVLVAAARGEERVPVCMMVDGWMDCGGVNGCWCWLLLPEERVPVCMYVFVVVVVFILFLVSCPEVPPPLPPWNYTPYNDI
jgi:hypothetical protein